eukprot:TRINITY_DN20723_c0_g1_i1.p1 TRINITY_DN20723_c0_g1~~TRINITY_DN20723_c0_g1_i1.p1  ORF type:complete len:260 (-),score=60.72 TRINITY_DN20723_c0_g1_i1:249-1028(-)
MTPMVHALVLCALVALTCIGGGMGDPQSVASCGDCSKYMISRQSGLNNTGQATVKKAVVDACKETRYSDEFISAVEYNLLVTMGTKTNDVSLSGAYSYSFHSTWSSFASVGCYPTVASSDSGFALSAKRVDERRDGATLVSHVHSKEQERDAGSCSCDNIGISYVSGLSTSQRTKLVDMVRDACKTSSNLQTFGNLIQLDAEEVMQQKVNALVVLGSAHVRFYSSWSLQLEVGCYPMVMLWDSGFSVAKSSANLRIAST